MIKKSDIFGREPIAKKFVYISTGGFKNLERGYTVALDEIIQTE